MIGPEVEPKGLGGFPRRRSSSRTSLSGRTWITYENLTEPPGIISDECGAVRWSGAAVDGRAADEADRAELAASPWWLWWNVLSFDASMVAMAWALVFAKSAGVRLPGAEVATLGLVVWMIYTVDRLLDGQLAALSASYMAESGAGAFGSPLRQRHVFHRIHARAIASIAAVVATFTAMLVVTQIGERVLRLAVPLGMILVLYMAWVHLGRGRVLVSLPKEVAVGGVFAAGVALPAWSRLGARRWEFFCLAALFAAVCTLNCVAIEEWERVRERGREIGSSRQGFATTDFRSGKFAMVLASCAALLTPVVRLRGDFSAIGAAIAVSALLILVLDLLRRRISADALRVLVDIALLVPAVAILVFVR